jgi:hypothetical protein
MYVRKKISLAALEGGEERWERVEQLLRGKRKISTKKQIHHFVVMVPCVYTLSKLIKLYILSMYSLLDVNYTSIKLLKTT